jgi:hypothetical protein
MNILQDTNEYAIFSMRRSVDLVWTDVSKDDILNSHRHKNLKS